jgi:hypothetical protein
MTNKYMKIYPISLVIKEMHIKTTFTHQSEQLSLRKQIAPNDGEDA